MNTDVDTNKEIQRRLRLDLAISHIDFWTIKINK